MLNSLPYIKMKHFLSLFLLATMLTACTATKQAVKQSDTTNTIGTAPRNQFVYEVAAKAVKTQNVTAKISADVNAGGKEVSLGGTLRMRRNEVIRLQLTFLGIAEVGTIEFSPNGVLIIDRLHKQYVRARYDQVDFLKVAGLDFYALQSLFWAELFVPGQKDVATALGRFSTSASGNYTLLTPSETPKLEYSFLATTATRLLERLTVRSVSPQNKGQFVARYGNYTALGTERFPANISLSATGIGKDFSLGLSLSSLSTSADWEAHITPPAKYTERTATDAFGAFFNL